MKIAFFGFFGAFDYFKIGGTESFSRRLAEALVRNNHQVNFVSYGSHINNSQQLDSGICLYSFSNLTEALAELGKGYDHVLTLYLKPRDRVRYLFFRRRHRFCIRFHQVYFSWPESALKRRMAFLDARIYAFNGRLFCISPRQYQYVKKWSTEAFLLLPPVGEKYFLTQEEKPGHKKLRLTYIGRTEPAKGIEEVIELFKGLKQDPMVQCEIHGFHHSNLAAAVRIHEWLSNQQEIGYVYTPFAGYSVEMEENLIATLKDTDILLLPYRRLSSTMETPMLLLEGMASLCAVIAPAVGNIPEIYGPSLFLCKERQEIVNIIRRVCNSPNHLIEERKRISQRNFELKFGTNQVTSKLIEAIS